MKNKLNQIINEINSLNKERTFYKLQSEWHLMMYKLTLRKEILEGLINEKIK